MGRKGKKAEIVLKPWQEKLSRNIAGKATWLQRAWAGWMDKRVNRLSPKAKVVVLVCFCLGMPASSLLPLPGLGAGANRADRIETVSIGKDMTAREPLPPILEDPVASRIRHFHRYLDSLSATTGGRKTKDSLINRRPGLLDSIRIIEKYYKIKSNGR